VNGIPSAISSEIPTFETMYIPVSEPMEIPTSEPTTNMPTSEVHPSSIIGNDEQEFFNGFEEEFAPYSFEDDDVDNDNDDDDTPFFFTTKSYNQLQRKMNVILKLVA